MLISFTLGSTKLDKSESNALLSLCSEGSITIDLLKHMKGVTSQDIFAKAVEDKNPKLASLAAKLAMEGGKRFNRSAKREYIKSGKTSVAAVVTVSKDPFDALHEILANNRLKNVGAAMILNSLADGHSRNLREIAEDCVNHLANFSYVSPDEAPRLFRGFERTKRGYVALISKTTERNAYHSSPIYTAMREGLKYLQSAGLVNLQKEVSFGSIDKSDANVVSQLQRKVYIVSLNKKGMQIMRNWNDSEDFIANFWKQ